MIVESTVDSDQNDSKVVTPNVPVSNRFEILGNNNCQDETFIQSSRMISSPTSIFSPESSKSTSSAPQLFSPILKDTSGMSETCSDAKTDLWTSLNNLSKKTDEISDLINLNNYKLGDQAKSY